MFTIMVFAFFFFLGFLVMFLYSEHKRDNLVRNLSDEHAQLRMLLRALESRLEHMEQGKNDDKAMPDEPATPEAQPAENDPLLSLSFDDPGGSRHDPMLELADLHEKPNNNRPVA